MSMRTLKRCKAEELRVELARRGWRQVKLADVAAISPATVTRILKPGEVCREPVARVIAHALGMRVDALFEDAPTPDALELVADASAEVA
jgi:transcriptional regulator with XRE-family HTH domain